MTKFSRALDWMSTTERICTMAGVVALGAATNATIIHNGGWQTTTAPVMVGMSLLVLAGARALGANPKGLGAVGVLMVLAGVAGESFNFLATGETTIMERDARAQPLREATARHNAAVQRLHDIERGAADSTRLRLAKQALAALQAGTKSPEINAAEDDLKAARWAADEEARNGGCRTVCKDKKAAAEAAEKALAAARVTASGDRKAAVQRAEQELRDAATAAEDDRKTEIEKAKADVDNNPMPADDAVLAHHIGWAPWFLDLLAAGLRSVAVTIGSAAMIAYGARRKPDIKPETSDTAIRKAANDHEPSPENPGPSGKSGKRGRRTNATVLQFADAFRARHGRTPTGTEIKAQFPDISRTTAYDYAAKVRSAV